MRIETENKTKMLGILRWRAIIISNQRDCARLLSKHYGARKAEFLVVETAPKSKGARKAEFLVETAPKNRGARDKKKVFKLSFAEATYLQNKGRLNVVNASGEKINLNEIAANAKELANQCAVYAKLRSEGYILSTDKVWGAQRQNKEYRVWILCEGDVLIWQQIFAETKLAAKQKKDLLLAIVDKDKDVTLEEIQLTILE
ncbi:MAG: hypothetical protein CVU81_01315 [Euryarchaeota archaeon HGW-Euryarchaeota-1]|nr:MAG: hypothetical protein CVU81_01315 [Euryarchaeota archaeon HGW-Euryarchaeota-1]